MRSKTLTWASVFLGDHMFTHKSVLRLTSFCKSDSCWFWFSNFSFCSRVHFISSSRIEMFLSGLLCREMNSSFPGKTVVRVCEMKVSCASLVPWWCLRQSCSGFPPCCEVFSSAVPLPALPLWLYPCSPGPESAALSSEPANRPAVQYTNQTPSGPCTS